MCLDTITDTNETPKTVPGDNFDADTDLEYDKYFYNAVSDEDNKNLHIPILPTLSDESAFPMIADKDAVDYIHKNLQVCGTRSFVCTHGAATCTYNCTKWCSSYLWWRSWEKEKQSR